MSIGFTTTGYGERRVTPDKGMSRSSTPSVHKISFGDGYEQRTPDGIQNNLLQIDLTFPTRNEDEASAILHFFHTRNATEGFVFYPPKPYNVAKVFRSPSWDSTVPFQGNFSIKAAFIETSI